MLNSACFTLPSKGRVASPRGVLSRAPFFAPPSTLRCGIVRATVCSNRIELRNVNLLLFINVTGGGGQEVYGQDRFNEAAFAILPFTDRSEHKMGQMKRIAGKHKKIGGSI